jgi:four helix bundle protein
MVNRVENWLRACLDEVAMRDYRKLAAFQKADALVIDVYKWTEQLPAAEDYVLRSQIRRSAISVPANIVEGSARTTLREYASHLNIALGSAAELRYLLELTGRILPVMRAFGKSATHARRRGRQNPCRPDRRCEAHGRREALSAVEACAFHS